MVASITIYKGAAGLNTVLDPQRLSQGSINAPNIIELAEAANVSIDERGLTTSRYGSVPEHAGEYHSIFCKNGGECFVIQENELDASLVQVLGDYSLSTVAGGLTKGLYMAWDRIGNDTFYSNGIDKGYIRGGVAYPWPVQQYNGPDVDMQFATAIPAITHLAFLDGGKLVISVGNAIFQNHLPYQYGLFSPGVGNVAAFATDVTMIAAVENGFFASDQTTTKFFRKTEDWYRYRQEPAKSYPALEWSLAHDDVELKEIGFDMPGNGRVWGSTKGIILGTDDGQSFNLSEPKVRYPSGYTQGACLIKKDSTVIHTAR